MSSDYYRTIPPQFHYLHPTTTTVEDLNLPDEVEDALETVEEIVEERTNSPATAETAAVALGRALQGDRHAQMYFLHQMSAAGLLENDHIHGQHGHDHGHHGDYDASATPAGSHDEEMHRGDPLEELNRSLNVIQGDPESDFRFGVNLWGSTDQKERFDIAVNQLRHFPSRDNLAAVEAVLHEDGASNNPLGEVALAEWPRLERLVRQAEYQRGRNADPNINVSDGIQPVEGDISVGNVSTLVHTLRGEEGKFSNWSLQIFDSSNREDWNDTLDNLQEAVLNGDSSRAHEIYARLAELATATGISSSGRDALYELEAYINVATA